MNRRDFLSYLGAGTGIALWPKFALAVEAARYDRLLILIELKGGNDGLNTVVPYADPAYRTLRPRLALPHDQLLQISGREALHPALKPLMPLWQAGEIAVVQGVGYQHPDLSHFRSIEIWDTASDAGDYLDSGWLARVFAQTPSPRHYAADGVAIGSAELGPLAGNNIRAISLNNPETFLRQARKIQVAGGNHANPALDHILRVRGDVAQASGQLNTSYVFKTGFPNSVFGNAVRASAQVAASQGGVAVIRITHGSFDTHSNQLPQQQRLLGDLAEGVVALKSALTELGRWQNTLILTYAEFGRRPAENGSGGTDHGTANTHFAFGGRVRGGLYGKAPELNRLEGGNLIHAVDYRSLYASVMQQHWHMDSRSVLGNYPALDFLRSA